MKFFTTLSEIMLKNGPMVRSYHSQLRGCINKVVSALYNSWVLMRKGHSWFVLWWKLLLHSLHFLENSVFFFVLVDSETATSMILSHFTTKVHLLLSLCWLAGPTAAENYNQWLEHVRCVAAARMNHKTPWIYPECMKNSHMRLCIDVLRWDR